MFEKVLVANRGEIACRAIRTLRRMGLGSVAVYSSADAQSLHVLLADEAVAIGEALAQSSYLDANKLLLAAERTGAKAVFPGYGFLSENADFAERCAERGVVFIGPTPGQLRDFGLKHRARELAARAGVPLLPGSGLLDNLESARREAERVGYPVMLKSTAGGGGIGLLLCEAESELAERFATVVRLGNSNFSQGGVFIEKFVRNARHIEVQIFGDGRGNVVALGERDCSAQRRNQKVIEETPAPELPALVRTRLREAALSLARGCNYQSAGTVEFVYDRDGGDFYFLEVNTRLQVEHGITELVCGVDLVEWMIRTAQGQAPPLHEVPVNGHAIEARVYAEVPAREFRPSSGLLTEVQFPATREGLRIDTWVETGVEVTPFYDPLLAKVMVHAATREQAIAELAAALHETRIEGVDTNLEYLCDILQLPEFVAGELTTRGLQRCVARAQGIEVIEAGTFSTIQETPGRLGLWDVGIPPSGPMDPLSPRLANRVLGNAESAPCLEMTQRGATLLFHVPTLIALAGADMQGTLDGEAIARYVPVPVRAGQRLQLGAIQGAGARAYLCVLSGFAVPSYLGSRATFSLGRFGGHGGRSLQPGDTLKLNSPTANEEPLALPVELQPPLLRRWQIGVSYGPHGAPDFFTTQDIEAFFAADWEVHYNSARTGVRLIGPKPEWARPDGGEAGLHPSNLHDNAYAFGAVDYTGDMPIILGPDGPSLGGFVCPATVVHSELWKVGQLAPGDKVRFVPLSLEQANEQRRIQDKAIAERRPQDKLGTLSDVSRAHWVSPIIQQGGSQGNHPGVAYRIAGDRFLLIEYGPMVLDLTLRFRVHSLMGWLKEAHLPGVVDLTPGIRSLMVQYDSQKLALGELLRLLSRAEEELPAVEQMRVPTRIVHLPLSWDDEATQLAIRKYTQVVRKDAPWAPSNIEFIRRINGLADEQAVKDIVFGASYLVLGLGDVYLGAPVATPLDPRHRLVTTKYNPARTWTPENAVGIGGAYLCIYGMEGPGGYQFVGRTLQVYNRFRSTRDFAPGKPWLLRFFDQLRFYPVSNKELLGLREAFAAGRHQLEVREETFDLAEYQRFLTDNAASIQAFKAQQQAAFDAERARWVVDGSFHFSAGAEASEVAAGGVPDGANAMVSSVPGSVWRVDVEVGQRVDKGQKLVVLESMKMEIAVEAPSAGKVLEVRVSEGGLVQAGQILVVIEAS